MAAEAPLARDVPEMAGDFTGHPRDVVVIGYGNELRGDDAVGPRVAEAVEGWDHPRVQVLVAHQLLPEMADLLAAARVAVFVDASVSVGETRVEPIVGGGEGSFLPHAGDPGNLLALAQVVYGRSPEKAWLVQIPAVSFDPSETLSAATTAGMAQALDFIRSLL